MTHHVARYRVLSALAKGGAGEVYRARAPDGAVVALKVLRGPFTERRQRRAEVEVRSLEKLAHPAILPLLDHGWEQGSAYLVFPLAEGGSLQERIKREGQLDEGTVLRLAERLIAGLQHAHAQGVLHRDLKPDNVILTADGPRLIDFGLALELEASYSRVTVSGTFLGTPGFWAPEQAQGALERLGPWTDVYGLGATLYTCLTARPPFVAESLAELLSLVVQRATPPSPATLRPGLDPALAALCLECMAYELEERPSLDEVAERVRALLRPTTPADRARRWLLPAVLAAAASVVAAGVVLWRARDVEPLPSPSAPVATPRAEEAPIDALCTLSSVVLDAGAYDLSEAYAEAALQLEPGSALAFLRRGNARYFQRRYALAGEDFARALELGLPSPADGFLNLGSCLRHQGKRELAREAYLAGLALDPDFGQLLEQLAGMALDAGDYGEALAYYTRALEADPRPFSLLNRGTCYLQAERYAEAIADLERATAQFEAAGRRTPSAALAWENLGLARIYQGADSAAAVEAMRRACALDPSAGRYARLAHALREHQAPQQAIAALDRALELEPDYALAYSNRAELASGLSLFERALADSLRAVELAPEDARLWDTRGRVLARVGQDVEAIRAYDRSLALRPDDVDVLHNRGSAKGRQGDFAGAAADYTRVLELAPTAWQTRYSRSFAYEGLGQRDDARADLRYLVQRGPPQWANSARDRLAELGE